MSDKQQWIYTEDGPELDKKRSSKLSKIKLNKWFFIIPWAFLTVLIIGLFSVGGTATGWGIFFVIFGPMMCLAANYYTVKLLVLNPLRNQTKDMHTKINSNN